MAQRVVVQDGHGETLGVHDSAIEDWKIGDRIALIPGADLIITEVRAGSGDELPVVVVRPDA